MSVIESMGYALRCDFPGCDVKTGDIGEYSFWGDVSDAREEWDSADGYTGPEGDYCPGHTIWTGDDDENDPERRPLLWSLDALFLLAERRIADRIDFLTRIALYRVDRRCEDWRRRDEQAERREVARLRRMGVNEGATS